VSKKALSDAVFGQSDSVDSLLCNHHLLSKSMLLGGFSMAMSTTGADANSLRIHLLDMGTEKYGDCFVCQLGSQTILIDGGHQGDYKGQAGFDSIPTQLEAILGHAAPFQIDLLVVTHCHLDHIGCLPALVANHDLNVTWALVADEKFGFGRSVDAMPDRGRGPMDRLAAALREESRADVTDDAELERFFQDAVTLESRYIAMLKTLKDQGTRIVRYGRDETKALERAFAAFGFEILGPELDHLMICAEAIAKPNADAMVLAQDAMQRDGTSSLANLYRSIVAGADAEPGLDRPGRGAALNDQSIVIKLSVNGVSSLLTGDMQFAKSEVSGLNPWMKKLRERVQAAGPYHFIKLAHHASYNGLDEDVLAEWQGVKSVAISGGVDAGHPDPGVLELLSAHAAEVHWSRTDRNGHITVTFPGGQPQMAISRGELDDPTPNGDTMTPEVLAVGGAGTPETPVKVATGGGITAMAVGGGITEVTASAKIPSGTQRVTITFEVTPQPVKPGDGPNSLGNGPKQITRQVPKPLKTYALAGGRKLPELLFVTHPQRLEANIGVQEAAMALQSIKDAGQMVYNVTDPDHAFAEVREALHDSHVGVVIVGGYDVLPAQRVDALDKALRRRLGPQTPDDDNFIVWSDWIYGDRDDDGLPEVPVSRIPDAKSSQLVKAALQAKADPELERYGLRNSARPFADTVFGGIQGGTPILVSSPTQASRLEAGSANGSRLYYMLHGSDVDGSRFWGEDQGEMVEALNISNVPDSCSGLVFTGCCWGALTVNTIASRATPGAPLPVRTPESSLALRYLLAGAQAFIGCTGSHYSPTVAPYNYFGGPMHEAFWTRYRQDRYHSPAKALFEARIDYLEGMPHGQVKALARAFESKIYAQYTCLGLGW
jgi:beta-lactamase superfamily II metal-dependent hydrolase